MARNVNELLKGGKEWLERWMHLAGRKCDEEGLTHVARNVKELLTGRKERLERWMV